MTVIYSSDIKKDNPEYQAAINLQCHLLHRSDLLSYLMKGHRTLVVAGAHGKTTTTALLTAVLQEGALDPTFAVGGFVPQMNSNAGYGQGEFFVAEADESDGSFLKYHPWGAIVTNIDLDHMDYFKSESTLMKTFETFLVQVSSAEHLFFCGDDARLRAIALEGISYGFSPECALRATHFRQEGWTIIFDVQFKGQCYHDVTLPLTGQHNALNALAVFGMAVQLGISEEAIRRAFSSFCGVMRRCEKKGEAQGVLVLDDYAHHPTEIKAALKAIQQAVGGRRLIAVFQPHRYSRTHDCLGSWGKIFENADLALVTDIYGAREAPIPGLCSQQVVEEVNAASSVPCHYVPHSQLVSELASRLRPHDVVVTIGAGDIFRIGTQLLDTLAIHPITKWKVGVVFGGKSIEHEISLMSAKYVCASLRRDYYDLIEFGISPQGEWLIGNGELVDQKRLSGSSLDDIKPFSAEIFEQLAKCDIIFPVFHGPYGEDGTLQGFFDILGKPYTGCDHRSAAVCMDKALAKKLMIIHGVATAPFVDFSRARWKTDSESLLETIHSQLTYPMFAKPVHLGSSIGVKKVENEAELIQAIEEASAIDTYFLVEQGLKVREIEFAVIGNDELQVFPPGEILTNGKIYDFESKYGLEAMRCHPQVDLPDSLIEEGMALAKNAYIAAGCSGYARVDFFLDEQGKWWFNEINPIPGLTQYSLFPKMCEQHGLTGKELMDRLIILGLQRHRQHV